MIHKTTRSILSVLLAALLLVTSTPLTPAFADGGAVSLQSESAESRELEGDGTAINPYKIATANDLREFAKLVNDGETTANAVLTDDIDLNPGFTFKEDGSYSGPDGEEPHQWTPIGTSINQYRCTFDGDGHTIRGLYINSSDNDYKGLFGYVGTRGKVQNLSVSGSVKGNDYVGGVVGDNLGIVENCYNTGEVSGNSYVGGVVGYNGGRVGSVINCYNTGTVSGNRVGGVVGYNGDGRVKNCYNTGKVSGNSYVGGVAGGNSSSGTVTGCYFLQGTAEKGIGTGGTTGATELTAEEFADQSKFSSWDFTNTWEIESIFGRPTLKANAEIGGTANNPYKIFTATQLAAFRDLVNGANDQTADPDAHAKLMENIDLNPGITFNADGTYSGPAGVAPQEWTPIGTNSKPYTGTFNGDGHTISGLYIDSDTDYQGLFGYVSGTVQDLTVSGNVSGSYVGGVVGYNSGSVINCTNTGSVKGSGNNSAVGGVVGLNLASVTNCYNTGSVSGPDSGTSNYVGGVVGFNISSVTNCYNTGEVSGSYSGSGSYVGGVVGYNDSGISASVTNCYNTGSVTGVAGVTGSSDYVGGVVGQNFGGTVENCYNTGTVSSSGGHVDGVVGDNRGTVKNCYYQIDKGAIVGIGGTTADDTTTVAKTAAEFHSGEVAWLLQKGQTAAGEEDPIPQVWGQNIGEDKSPVLTSDQEKNVYRVPVDLNYTGAQADQVIYTNSTLNAKEPIREGYTFDGWYDNKACTGEAVTTITDPITTLYAKWTPNTYTVTLNTNGGTIAEGQNISSYTYGIGATLPTSVTREGYTFAGWYEKEDFTGDPVAAIGKDAMGDKTYWAKWEEVENPEPTPTPTPDPTPSGPSTGDSTGWDDIRDELENAENGDEITIDMGDETKVPAEIFESLAGKDVEISFDLGDIQWSVNGADIPTDTDYTDLDLGASLGTSGIPVNVINTITGERDTVQITLAHNGEFGFTMTLSAPLGKENAGYWANLYHYDEDAEALNFEAAAKIDETGSVAIPFSHASQYAIVIDTHSHAAVDVSDLFIDIAPDAWYKDAIQYAYDNGLMTGVSATEFDPEATTTRAMIVSILARLENVTTAQAAGFADVNDEWYATAVNWAANVGVVNGYEDNTFRPNTAITREQLAAILMNYAAYKGEDVSNRADLATYTDQPSTWAEEAMQWAVAEGLISGVTNDQLQPQSSATRAQVAAILQRLLEA